MIHGPSGILNVGPLDERPIYEPSKLLLTWPNGALGHVRSGAEPDKLRGLNIDTAWCDELASWQYARDAWDNLMMALRVGDHPRCVITTTPKPIALLRELVKASHVAVTRGSTYENREHLAETFFKSIVVQYEGTTLGQQELHAALLEEAEGALWSRNVLTATRVAADAVPALERIVVAVDPAITAKAESNETGVIVAARGTNGHGYILEDKSLRASPGAWAKVVVAAYRRHNADRVVVEANQGGDMVTHTLRTVDEKLPIKAVRATQGKRTRAEPIAAFFERGEAHMVGVLETLEDQLCTWAPHDGLPSPDRLDAMVWALTELLDTPPVAAVSVSPGLEQANYWAVA